MIEKPVFILGNIRSGTTILYNLIATHPDLCWFTYVTDNRPGARWPVALSRLLDMPVLGISQRRAILRNRPRRPHMHWLPWPAEGDRIYHEFCKFGQNPDGVETTLTNDMESKLKDIISLHLEVTRKPRFLSKQTANNRRLELLNRMFPDACFVHLIRDGRAVAYSTLREPWWNGMHVWWLGKKVHECDEMDPIELAALYWQRTTEEIRRHRPLLGERYMEVRYEELVGDTKDVVSRITSFCGLTDRPSYLRLLPDTLRNMNYKWRESIPEHRKQILHDCIGEYLAELGYPK
jgi:hypothetical protein